MKKIILAGLFFLLIFFAFALSVSGMEAQEGKTETHSIRYELNGGNNSILNENNIKEDDLPFKLRNPKKSGYSFGGWYEEKSFENRVRNLREFRDYHLYAKWNLNINSNQNVQDYPYQNNGKEIPLKELSYHFLYSLDTPGNPKTRVNDLLEDKYSSEYQCPQGLCITPDYYIVSSYAMENNKLGALTLYDRNSQEYIVSLGMEAESHLGGVTFDGENIWICHSNTNELEKISYDFIKRLASISNQNFIDISGCFTRYKVKNVPSCITYHKGILYVVTFRAYAPGTMYCYELKDNSLQLKEKILVPPKVQGIVLDETDQVWISQSYGRNRSSHLLVYSSVTSLREGIWSPKVSVEMPPGSEAVEVMGDVCFTLFETASYKYYEGSDGRGTCKYPIDKILMIDCNSIEYD